MISTGVPSGTSSTTSIVVEDWTQPCDTALPRSLGLDVPWIAIRPPPGQSESTGEKPDRPSAAIPYGGCEAGSNLPHVEGAGAGGGRVGADADLEMLFSSSWT